MNIVVLGGKGQLGQCIQEVSKDIDNHTFSFIDSKALDITNETAVNSYFQNNAFDYCINCAAYTAVDKAEIETELAHQVNALGAKYIAQACSKNQTKLIHISTDFVFDGTASQPYTETAKTNPISVYGKTKLDGEAFIQQEIIEYFILRTSWLYSEYANNFMKTMLKLSEDRNELSIIADQFGTPTYAKDLAKVVVSIINNHSEAYGLYHYSNEGDASWYNFAKKIFNLSDTDIKLNAIPTTEYPTPAERPKYSIMDKSKIKTNLGIDIPNWEDSLKVALKALQNL